MTLSSIATWPNSRKNSHTDTASSSTWLRLGDQQHQQQVGALAPVERLRVHVGQVVEVRLQRRAADGPAYDVRVEVVVDGGDLLGQPGDQEAQRQRSEERHREPEHRPGQRGGDLPHLGVDEEERDEQQQHRQRAGHQPEQRPQLGEGADHRPPRDRAGVEDLGRGDDAEDRQVREQHREHEVRVLLQDGDDRGRTEGEDRDLDDADPARPFQRALAAGQVGHRPDGDQARAARRRRAAAAPATGGRSGTATSSEPK